MKPQEMVDRCDNTINSCTNIDQLKVAKSYVKRYVYIFDWGKMKKDEITYFINYLHCRMTQRERELQVESL